MHFLFKQPHDIQLTHLMETVDVMARRIACQEGYIRELENQTGFQEREINKLGEQVMIRQ